MNNPLTWINGQVVPFAASAVPFWDLGLVAGAAVTEMARTVRHRPFRLEQHVSRLLSSCQALGFSVPFSGEVLQSAAEDLVRNNSRLIAPQSDLGIVAFVTAGANPTYLGGQPGPGTIGIHTFELPFAQWRNGLQHGVRLRIPGIRQLPAECLDVGHKIRNRLHWWLADREAGLAEAGSRALLLSQEGWITETSAACFYAVMKGEIVTSDRLVLNSLSRQVAEELAQSLGIPFRRRILHSDEIPQFEEAFISSTPCGLLPVGEIDGKAIGSPASRPVLTALQQAWNTLAGINLQQQILANSASPPAGSPGSGTQEN